MSEAGPSTGNSSLQDDLSRSLADHWRAQSQATLAAARGFHWTPVTNRPGAEEGAVQYANPTDLMAFDRDQLQQLGCPAGSLWQPAVVGGAVTRGSAGKVLKKFVEHAVLARKFPSHLALERSHDLSKALYSRVDVPEKPAVGSLVLGNENGIPEAEQLLGEHSYGPLSLHGLLLSSTWARATQESNVGLVSQPGSAGSPCMQQSCCILFWSPLI
jgi:hypothetical protein